jgi:hypothetical protein
MAKKHKYPGLSPGEMAKKHECPFDCGGYFIVRGKEKVGILKCLLFSIILDLFFKCDEFIGNSYPRARLPEQIGC